MKHIKALAIMGCAMLAVSYLVLPSASCEQLEASPETDEPTILTGVPGPDPIGVRIEPLGEYTLTAYCSCPICCGIWSEQHPSRIGTDYKQTTHSGMHPEAGRTVAADWDVLPAGTQVAINGTIYTVEDTGSAVKGKHIDIYFDNHEEAKAFGLQYEEVYRICASL